MSSNITSPSKQKDITSSPSGLKGKAKAPDSSKNAPHQAEEDEDDDDDDDDEDDRDEGMKSDDEDDEEVEDQFEEIDPTAIRTRRTRGVRVDYTSKEALEKAGLKAEEVNDDDDEDVHMKD